MIFTKYTVRNEKKRVCLHRLYVEFITELNAHFNHIGGVMVSVFASSAVDRGFEPQSGQTKDYNIGICCFSAKYATLRRKNKDWLVRNQDNVSERGDMSIRGLLFHWASTMQIQLSV